MRIYPTGGSNADLCRDSVAIDDCDRKNVRVCVDGVEIPVVESRGEDQAAVEVQVRKDGAGYITRLSDVYFPAHWKGEDIFSHLPLDEDDVTAVPVRIDGRPPDGGDWQTVHYGWLRKIGSGGDGRLMRMRVDDYVKILETTFVSGRFGASETINSIDSVLSFVEDKIEEKNNVDIPVTDESFQMQIPDTERADDVETGVQRNVPSNVVERNTLGQYGVKTFQSNRDTVVDVLDWVVSQVDGGYWYVGYDNGPAIIVGRDFNPEWRSLQAGGATVIRKNMAMENINPVNAVRVTGQTGFTIFGKNIDLFSTPNSEYPIAEATHIPLLERADGIKHAKPVDVESTTEDTAAAKAKKLLREELSGASESTMVLNGNPSIMPYGNIYAKPVCDQYVDGSAPTVGYGIERVKHVFPTTGLYTTEISVGLKIDPGDIEITEKTTANATGEGTEDDRFESEFHGGLTGDDPLR